MKEQYMINISGNIENSHSETYVVSANSEAEAQKIACNIFNSNFNIIGDTVNFQSFKRTKNSIIAIILMLIPILLSFISWKNGHKSYELSPSYISCLYSVIFYASFILRFKDVRQIISSKTDIFLCICILLLLSSFIQTMFVTKTFKLLFWKIPVNTHIILLVGMLFSLVGVKLISVLCIASIGILAIFNIIGISDAMGYFWGPVYIICSFMGILFYSSVEPAFLTMKATLKESVIKTVNYGQKDFLEAKKQSKSLINSTLTLVEKNISKGD